MNFYCIHLTESPTKDGHRFPYHTVILLCCDECIKKFKVITAEGGRSKL